MDSPLTPNGYYKGFEESLLDKAQFQKEISDKMKVPKMIKANGEISDEDYLLYSQNGMHDIGNHELMNMDVPDRIIVVGHNKTVGARTLPRPIEYENSIMPKLQSDYIRVQTPPRVLTLSDHSFPTVSEDNSPSKDIEDYEDDELSPPTYVQANGPSSIGFDPENGPKPIQTVSRTTTKEVTNNNFNPDDSIISRRDGTPIQELTPHEEILYMRRQLAKMNRRVLSLEINNEQRLQREKIIYYLGLAYFAIKAIFWFNRS